MDESDLRAYQKYLKKAISLAQKLSTSENPTIYELGHYLADNVLAKVCMVIAKRKNNRGGRGIKLRTVPDTMTRSGMES